MGFCTLSMHLLCLVWSLWLAPFLFLHSHVFKWHMMSFPTQCCSPYSQVRSLSSQILVPCLTQWCLFYTMLFGQCGASDMVPACNTIVRTLSVEGCCAEDKGLSGGNVRCGRVGRRITPVWVDIKDKWDSGSPQWTQWAAQESGVWPQAADSDSFPQL